MTRKGHSKHRGGSGSSMLTPAPWTSGASYEMANYGTENQQYQSVFGPNPAPNDYGNFLVNQLKPEASLLPESLPKNAGTLVGGKRHRKGKKGGFMGEVLNQAIVPFGLAALQQSYKKKRGFMPKYTRKSYRKKSNSTRRRRRRF